MQRIGIVDYGMGNLYSVEKAVQTSGASTRVTSKPDELASFDKIVVPGVGAFGDAVDNVRKWGLWNPILDFVKTGNPMLGICVGMQLMLETSYEKGIYQGFGIVPGNVKRFPQGQKVPQIGWNQVRFSLDRAQIFEGIPDCSYFYFVHSYYTAPTNASSVIGSTEYGLEYASAIREGNAFGVQFHPEKSQQWGLKILENFVKL